MKPFREALFVIAVAILACGAPFVAAQPGPSPIADKPAPVGNPTDCPESPGNACVITVTITPGPGGSCSGDAITLAPAFAKLLDMNTHKKVTFRIATAGYEFCARGGDGAFFVDPIKAEPNFDVDPKGKCDREFDWKRKQREPAGNPPVVPFPDHSFLLRFRNSAAKIACIKDPWIRNG